MRLAPLKRCFRPPFAGWLAGGCLLVTTGLLPGCKRLDGDTVVSGAVVDRSSTAFVPHATVVVYEAGRSGGLGGGYVEVERHQADATGHFSFRLSTDRNGLLLRAFSELGAYTIWQEAPSLRGGRNNNDLQLKVQSPAWLKVRLTNDNQQDSACVNLYGFSTIGEFFWVYRDTVVIYPTLGADSAKVHWDLTTLGGVQSRGYQVLYCPALDTVPLEIRY